MQVAGQQRGHVGKKRGATAEEIGEGRLGTVGSNDDFEDGSLGGGDACAQAAEGQREERRDHPGLVWDEHTPRLRKHDLLSQ